MKTASAKINNRLKILNQNKMNIDNTKIIEDSTEDVFNKVKNINVTSKNNVCNNSLKVAVKYCNKTNADEKIIK